MNKLSFGKGNAKLGKSIFTFSLPSGFTCPGALECMARANRQTGKLSDGPRTKFRCFSASQEAMFPNVRKQRWDNFELLQQAAKQACETMPLEDTIMAENVPATLAMANLILESLPAKATIVRVHVAGDFFNQNYFDAWMLVAMKRPDVKFYAYTKSVNFWTARQGAIPANFELNASYGGRHDEKIKQLGLKHAKVVFTELEATELGLEIDHDDSHAYTPGPSFALLLHGTQPKGSDASKAVRELKGVGSYGRGTKG